MRCKVSPKSNDQCPFKELHTEEGNVKTEARFEFCYHEPGNVKDCLHASETGRESGMGQLLLQLPEGTSSTDTLISDSQTVRKYISVALRYSIFGSLLGQALLANTDSGCGFIFYYMPYCAVCFFHMFLDVQKGYSFLWGKYSVVEACLFLLILIYS